MDIKRKIYRTLEQWAPPQLFPTIVNGLVLLDDLLSKDDSNIKKHNEALKKCRTGDAFVLATGPSIKDIDLGFLKGKDCFSVSNFFLHHAIHEIAPRMHFFAPYHEPLILSEFISWMNNADRALPKTTAIVLGDKMRSLVAAHNLFEGRSIHYLKLRKGAITKSPDLTRPVLSPYTSPLMVLPVLHYMGYERVFLLGCDHNTIKDYGKTIENFYDPSQDIRSNATSGKKWDQGVVYTLKEAINVFEQYKHYNDIYKSSGREIYNMSPSSWLDFIPYFGVDRYIQTSQSLCEPIPKREGNQHE